MGKSSKAPNYATTSYNTGNLFGNSTTNKSGTTYNPTDTISNTGNTAWNSLNSTLNSLNNNDWTNDANFQAYQNQLNKTMTQNYDNSVLSNLANRGLMRSSGLQSATNSFADTLADQTINLYDNYYNRLSNNLSQYQNTLNNLYNYITGVNTGSQNLSQNVSNYNLEQAKLNDNSKLWASLANSLANTSGNITSAAILASDINVKENLRKIGTKKGYNWYEFTYKDGYNLPEGRQEGVIAQEIEKIRPDAVIEIDGIKHVDYAKL